MLLGCVVHGYECAGMPTQGCIWRDQKKKPGISLFAFSPIAMSWDLSGNRELVLFRRLASQWALGNLSVLAFQIWVYRHLQPCLAYYMDAGIQTQVLIHPKCEVLSLDAPNHASVVPSCMARWTTSFQGFSGAYCPSLHRSNVITDLWPLGEFHWLK